MESFELRSVCNSLLNEINQANSKKNIIKLSIDVQVPDRLFGCPIDLSNTLKTLLDYLNTTLVNGIVSIEISLMNHYISEYDLKIGVSGYGLSGTSLAETEAFKTLLAQCVPPIRHKTQENQLHFEFNLPFKADNKSSAVEKLIFDKIRILLVEDNEINAMVFSSFLEDWGCENTLAINGAEAVNLATEHMYDAILMDLHMPILNGFEAIKKIRELNTSIPIIALTASTSEEDIKKAMAAGANNYLNKPVSSAQLFQVLSKYLSLSHS